MADGTPWEDLIGMLWPDLVGVFGISGTFGIPVYIYLRGRRSDGKIRRQIIGFMLDWLEDCTHYRRYSAGDAKIRLLKTLVEKRDASYDLLLTHAQAFAVNSVTEMVDTLRAIRAHFDILSERPDDASQNVAFNEHVEYIKQYLHDAYPREYRDFRLKLEERRVTQRWGFQWSIASSDPPDP
ncbi:MAG: hypothetical protein MPI95_04235 [Nitrosopumilus sp.]|nr:hypothetical protein [Nitrosopumilus sp.]CAI9831606.1 hypothetical protein IBTHAUMO2_320032 [Nitrosopumilaceae archaeon]MDA7941570.1 hypothetical protein [Nitrosopumilus sp.]MDA7943577.1 hypothetical protein [Nitrosopumilus sp.]MDA7945038.1 hypothetical protein [Nitrosopumilus sp.]